MKRLILGAIGIALLFSCSSRRSEFYLGIDNHGDRFYRSAEFFDRELMSELGAQFVIYHYRGPEGTVAEEAQAMRSLGEKFAEAGLGVLVNVETGNMNATLEDADGVSWVEKPAEPTHLFRFPQEVIDALGESPAVWGIQYDELEHTQIFRNLSLALEDSTISKASLAETNGLSIAQADSAVASAVRALSEYCKSSGLKYVIDEHVWPVLFDNFGRSGITPVYKQMKEAWSNVWSACAMGAALENGTELWACLDFWFHDHFPGHSAEELYSNLLFAYWTGVDKAYVEAVGAGMYEKLPDGSAKLLDRGEAYAHFAKDYLPQNPRPYSFRDYLPRTAIIRFDDTEFGQGPQCFSQWKQQVDGKEVITQLNWPDWLFGAKNLRTSPESEEWLKAWNTITHGVVPSTAMSWAASVVYEGIPHRSFAPANAPVVFSDSVRADRLKSVKLAFLCGLKISPETLTDVALLVKKGLTVVTSSRFAPSEMASQYTTGTREFSDGRGRWILTDDMASTQVKALVKPLLGQDDELTYYFKGGRSVKMAISEDGNELEINKEGF